MLQQIEIMHFKQGKLCVANVELCAKLCANSNKKEPFSFILHTFRLHSLLKRVRMNKQVLTNFCSLCNRMLFKIHIIYRYIETLKHIITH